MTMPLRLDNARVSVDTGNGWQEIHGIRDMRLNPTYNPPDWIEGYGLGEIRGLLASVAVPFDWRPALTPVHLALIILRPHLERCPLYRP
ncbi:hypothetical protein ACW4TU_30310 [Streptomyces sp. QTS52]